jgi:hypothetical protein
MTSRPGWPALLRDVPKDAPCVTTTEMQTSQMAIPAGTRGRLLPGSTWDRFSFRTEPCPCCGVKMIVHRVHWSNLRLTDS